MLSLDPAQYQLDVNAAAAGEAPDVYATFNVLMRRDAKENNFKVRLQPQERLHASACCVLSIVIVTVCSCVIPPAAAAW